MWKLWIDDVRVPPTNDYIWCRSVVEAKSCIFAYEHQHYTDQILIDLDHDAGEYVGKGGDYIKILDWLEEKGYPDMGYFFHIHSMNPVGIENMKRIIEKNGWRLV